MVNEQSLMVNTQCWMVMRCVSMMDDLAGSWVPQGLAPSGCIFLGGGGNSKKAWAVGRSST